MQSHCMHPLIEIEVAQVFHNQYPQSILAGQVISLPNTYTSVRGYFSIHFPMSFLHVNTEMMAIRATYLHSELHPSIQWAIGPGNSIDQVVSKQLPSGSIVRMVRVLPCAPMLPCLILRVSRVHGQLPVVEFGKLVVELVQVDCESRVLPRPLEIAIGIIIICFVA